MLTEIGHGSWMKRVECQLNRVKPNYLLPNPTEKVEKENQIDRVWYTVCKTNN